MTDKQAETSLSVLLFSLSYISAQIRPPSDEMGILAKAIRNNQNGMSR